MKPLTKLDFHKRFMKFPILSIPVKLYNELQYLNTLPDVSVVKIFNRP